jgi:Spy/CpxP family protein refolding chaperone
MKNKTGLWLRGLGVLLVAALLSPALAQPKKEGEGSHLGIPREKLIIELNLSPDKAQEFLAVGGKYDQTRQEVIERIKKNEYELEKELKAPQCDEGKINKLVTAIISDHDVLFETFKAQRQEEMALLTPVQRGKFLLALKKWHEEMAQKEKKE